MRNPGPPPTISSEASRSRNENPNAGSCVFIIDAKVGELGAKGGHVVFQGLPGDKGNVVCNVARNSIAAHCGRRDINRQKLCELGKSCNCPLAKTGANDGWIRRGDHPNSIAILLFSRKANYRFVQEVIQTNERLLR